MRRPPLLKVLMRAYGALVALVFGSYFVSLLAHDDVMLFKAPRHLNWVAGDIVLLLLVLWGGLFALSVGRKRWMGFLCVFLAAAISILTGFAGSPWGVLTGMVLFLLPSVIVVLLHRVGQLPIGWGK